jgi:hypothetical protein
MGCQTNILIQFKCEFKPTKIEDILLFQNIYPSLVLEQHITCQLIFWGLLVLCCYVMFCVVCVNEIESQIVNYFPVPTHKNELLNNKNSKIILDVTKLN